LQRQRSERRGKLLSVAPTQHPERELDGVELADVVAGAEVAAGVLPIRADEVRDAERVGPLRQLAAVREPLADDAVVLALLAAVPWGPR
jgi:hypothetical protein